MIPLIIGAALAAGGTALNAIKNAKQNKKMRLYFDKREKEAKNDYNNSLGDASQSAAVQAAETRADKAYQEGISTLNNAVNSDPVKRAKILDSINAARADQASQNAVMGEQMRQQAKAQYKSEMNAIDAARMNQSNVESQQATEAYNTLTQVGGQFINYGMSSALNGSGGNVSKGLSSSTGSNSLADVTTLKAPQTMSGVYSIDRNNYSNSLGLRNNISSYTDMYRNKFYNPMNQPLYLSH